jgi:small-conductance mechanosensitive channel
MPSIFVDLVRLVIIVTGLALMLSRIWDANVGGLFAALGVTSIVIGLALQNSVGSINSGLAACN